MTYKKIRENFQIAENHNLDFEIVIPQNLTRLYNSEHHSNYPITLETQIETYNYLLKEFIFEEINRKKLLNILNTVHNKRISLDFCNESQIKNTQKLNQDMLSKVYKYERKIKEALNENEENKFYEDYIIKEENKTIDEPQEIIEKEEFDDTLNLNDSITNHMNEIENDNFKCNKITFAMKTENIVMDSSEEDEAFINSLNISEINHIDEFTQAMEEYEKMMQEKLNLLENDYFVPERKFANLESFQNDLSIPNRKDFDTENDIINISQENTNNNDQRLTSHFSSESEKNPDPRNEIIGDKENLKEHEINETKENLEKNFEILENLRK